jgi:hypothetical protein
VTAGIHEEGSPWIRPRPGSCWPSFAACSRPCRRFRPPGAPAGDETPQRVAAFRKAYFGDEKKTPALEEKRRALEFLKGYDAPIVANALLDAYSSCEEARAARVDEQNRAKDELAKISADQALGARQFPQPTFTRMKELRTRIGELDGEVAAIAGLEREIVAPILAVKSDESFRWLLTNALGPKRLPLQLKISIARLSASRGPATAEAVAQMTMQLAKAKEGEEVYVLVDGLAACGAAARPSAPTIAARLAEKEPTLREHAAAALVALAAADGIEPLIRALEAETDAHTRRRIAVALETLTRQQFGETAPAWRGWWKGEGEKAFAGGRRGRRRLGARQGASGAAAGTTTASRSTGSRSST